MRPVVVARRGDLVVERDPSRPSGRLLRQLEMDASYVDLADPSHLEFDYLRWMRIVLGLARARRILHLGGGACALPRALAAEDPARRQLVCEVDETVLAMAREHMGLRRAAGLRVRVADGRSLLAAQGDGAWEAVVVDAFVGAEVPRSLITAEALRELARVAPLALLNVVDNRAARQVSRVAAGLIEAYPNVWGLAGRLGNTVLVGSARPLDLALAGARTAADPSPPRMIEPPAMARLAAASPALAD